jgi:hypothetical protein
MKAQSVKRSPISSSHGMSLGWRLGLSTAVTITLVIGVLTFFQQWYEIRQDWKDRDRLLGEALIPLASDLESAKTLEEVRVKLTSFQQALSRRGRTDYHIDLYDEEGRLIVSSASEQNSDPPGWTLYATVPIHSTWLQRGRGNLRVWKGGSRFKAEVEERWVFWLLDIGVTVLCILISLQIAYQYLIARPLRCLMKNIHHMEMGYWEGFEIPQGAWEMQWLAYRFQNLGSKLEETMKRLVEAERLALLDSHCHPPIVQGVTAADITASNDFSPPPKAIASLENEGSGRAMRLYYLMEKCCFLESQTPADPTAQISAQEVWEQDIVEAERLCKIGLKCRLENAAFRILNPDAYEQLSRELAAMTISRRGWVKERKKEIHKMLKKHQLSCLTIQHRIKTIGSVWRKMQAKGLTLEQIDDIFAFRIIVPEERHCYLTLDAIHHHFQPKLLRFKDYIANPKANGYQSIHTCVQDADNFTFEVQIRTEKMHWQADGGTAAHWSYKGEQVKLGASTWLSRKWNHLKAVLGLGPSP